MPISRRRALRRLGGFAVATATMVAAPRILMAASDARHLSFRNIHNEERLDAVYWSNGDYDAGALRDIDFILRDWRNDAVRPIDRGLLDLLYELESRLGAAEPYEVISAYRSPETNEMLAAQNGGVATKSLHMDGVAIDIALGSGRLEELRDTAWTMQRGGVGYYAGSGFVHVDTGRVRHWNF
ncbi:MAG: DUF882 domain-containing protein [Rhodospirillaceae bacterium]|nr:DUF882 domain-containing protein [Rhodospirillaceae bacterium]